MSLSPAVEEPTDAAPPVDPARWLMPIYPTLMIGTFFLIPFLMILAISVAHKNPGGAYEFGFDPSHFQRFLTKLFVNTALFSVAVSALVSVSCLVIGFPFTYLVTRLKRRFQVIWLIFILAQLALSEVLIAFSWQILLSRTAGVANVAVWLGLMDRSVALYPSGGAVALGLVYLVLPFAVLILYPALSRLDPMYTEAARTLGASPARAFFNVVIPSQRPAIVATGITLFVFTLGALLIPQVLGRPQHWTLSVLITDQAIFQSNIPFASALAVFLLVLSMSLVGIVLWLNRRVKDRQ